MAEIPTYKIGDKFSVVYLASTVGNLKLGASKTSKVYEITRIDETGVNFKRLDVNALGRWNKITFENYLVEKRLIPYHG